MHTKKGNNSKGNFVNDMGNEGNYIPWLNLGSVKKKKKKAWVQKKNVKDKVYL